MTFPGRIHREEWIAQAQILVGQKASNTDTTDVPSTATGHDDIGSSGDFPDSMKPTLLSAPEGGKADNLKRVKGIGKVLERHLYKMGIYHYEQLAELSPDNISWLTDCISFPENCINDEKSITT